MMIAMDGRSLFLPNVDLYEIWLVSEIHFVSDRCVGSSRVNEKDSVFVIRKIYQ